VTLRLPLTLLVLTTACVTSRPAHYVRSVNVQGNHEFKDSTIVDRLATRPPQGLIFKQGQPLDRLALQLDRRRIEAFYHANGFFDAQVTNVDVQDLPDGATVKIEVEEGLPTRIASIDFVGTNADFARGALRRKEHDIKEGRRFAEEDYQFAKDALLQALVEAGYAHAKVDGVVAVDRDQLRARIQLYADLGPLVHFGQTKIEGLKNEPESAVRDRIAWKEGEVFDPKKLKNTEGKLYAMGLFGSVRTDWEKEGRPAISDVTIKVTEGPKHELRLGFGAGLDRQTIQLRLRGGYTMYDVLGPLTTFRADVTPGYSWLRGSGGQSGPTVEAVTTLDRQDLVIPQLKGTLLAAYQREPREGYFLTGPRFNVGLDRPFLNDALQVHVGWEIRLLQFLDYDPMVFGGAATRSRLGYYEQRLVVDERDVPLDAREGWYAGLTLNEGGPIAGGVSRWHKEVVDLRGYLPLFWHVTLAGRATGGRLDSDERETPLPVRFYGGGANDHRGFGFRRLSPQARDSKGTAIPTGGDEMLLGTAEARIDMFKLRKEWVTLATFLDAGDVTTQNTMDLAMLHYAVGLGLRYNTIIGPIRADVGMRLNRVNAAGADGLANPDPGARFAFHLSLGEAF
jgi:translocation and assembly module TamA